MEGTGNWEGLLFLAPVIIVVGAGYGFMITSGTKWLKIKKVRFYGWAIVFTAMLFLMISLGGISLIIGVFVLKAPILESSTVGVCLAVLITTLVVGLRIPRKTS